MEEEFNYQNMISQAKEECAKMTVMIHEKYPNVEFEVLEEDSLDNFTISDIAEFYNINWLGDRDYMHIPDAKQISENLRKHIVIVAKEKGKTGKNAILAISTVKHHTNTQENIDPCYPKEGPYFELTGVLANNENRNRKLLGFGRMIYQIGIASTKQYNEKWSGGGPAIAVIDCTNAPSFNALRKAAIEEQSKSGIIGFYTVYDRLKRKMAEAPTFVCKIFNEDDSIGDSIIYDENYKLSMYDRYNAKSQYASSNTSKKLAKILKETIWKKGTKNITDDADGIVTTYFEVEKPIINFEITNVGKANKRKRQKENTCCNKWKRGRML